MDRRTSAIKAIAEALKRAVKSIILFIRRRRRAFSRLTPRGKLASLGIALGSVAALAAIIVLIASSGQNASAARSVEDVNNTEAAVAFDITPSPTVAEATPTPTPEPTPEPTVGPDDALKRGDTGVPVKTLQLRLIALGYLEVDEPTYYFGPATEDAVMRFQRQVNFTVSLGTSLDEDGVVGDLTKSILFSDDAPKYVVMYGMVGNDITDMQQQLVDLRYMKAVTGNYLEKTVEALKLFQSANGLSADGLCGEKTFSLLYSDEAKENPETAAQARTRANIDDMIACAKKQLGDPYVLGKTGPNSFDCSGLVYYCLKEGGSNRRRLSAAGYSGVSDWEKITSIYSLKKGDLIFFYNNGFTKVGHVGIVINNSGEMIDASSSNGKVVRRSYLTSYWKAHFVCGRRPW